MPRRDAATVAAIEESEAWSHEAKTFQLLDEGWYKVELTGVEVIGGATGRWDWTFQATEDEAGNPATGNLWWTTTTTPDSIGKEKSTWEAFDADPDTDTDELVGDFIWAYVVQEMQTKGKRANQLRNSITALKALGTEAGSPATGAKSTTADAKPF